MSGWRSEILPPRPFDNAAGLRHQADVFTLFSALTIARGRVANAQTPRKEINKRRRNEKGGEAVEAPRLD